MSKQLTKCFVLGLCLISPSLAFAALKEYHLKIEQQTVNITGKPLQRITVNGQFPAPLLEFEEGDDAVIHVQNHLKNQDSSIHWHGLLLPGLMDGVPGFNQFKGIPPQGDFVYRFKVRQNGTYWYHAHSKGQEQDGLYGALVIYPKGKKPMVEHENAQRDYVVMLSDFHESSSDQIMKNLKKSAEYYQNQRETLVDVFKQVKSEGLKNTWQDRKMWNQMRMLKTDLSDVTGYTFLVNGKTPDQNWTGMFQPNEKVRLRFINASAMSFFDVRIPNLSMNVVSADGQPVQPVAVDEFRIGTAETYDVIVEPKLNSYQIQAESIDRSGFALGSLHNQQAAAESVSMPKSRPRALLSMQDMGHGTLHEGQALGSVIDHSQMNHATMNHEQKDHQQINPTDSADHSDHHSPSDVAPQQKLEHATQTTAPMQLNAQSQVEGWANASTPVGQKALQYLDLKALYPQKDLRPAERELEVRLGGTMERYIWTINGKKFTEAEPLQVKYGERIRLKFINESMMAHPMHLHGMFMQLENGQTAQNMPNKHTLIVPPNQTVTALLTADELGEWAIHCHLLYHMSSGMMSKMIVAQVDDNSTLKKSTPPSEKQPSRLTQQGDSHAHH